MKIEYLADHPDYLPVLARWHYEAFKRLDPQATVEKYIAKLQHTLRRGEIPVTFVALSGNTLLGSASLFQHDMSTREELAPWLAAVYVAPEHRRQGVGSALVRRAVVEAKGIGVEKLYLYTPDMEHFYVQLGWSVLERTEYRGWKVVIMEIDLTGVTNQVKIPTITTARLILRGFTEADVEPLHRILGEEGVLRFFPNTDPPPRDRVQRLILGQLKHWEERGYGWWAIEPRRQSELIGWSGLQFLPETEEIEVAYLLGKAFWGQGFATEAARASLQYGFETLNLESIVGIVHPENIPSQRVIEKLGMTFTTRTPYFGMDCYRYAIERSSWSKKKGWL